MTVHVTRMPACPEGCCLVTFDSELLPAGRADVEVRPMFELLCAHWGAEPASWYAEGGPDELATPIEEEW